MRNNTLAATSSVPIVLYLPRYSNYTQTIKTINYRVISEYDRGRTTRVKPSVTYKQIPFIRNPTRCQHAGESKKVAINP